MPVPNHPDKLRGTPILTGQKMIAYRRQIGRFPQMDPPRGVVVCLETSLPKKARRRHPYNQVGRFVGDMLMLRKTRGRVGVMVNMGVGAPTVVALAEELIAWGVKNLALISFAGGLQKDLAEGDIVVCERAIRDEGTSHHYLPDQKYAQPGSDLTAALVTTLEAQGTRYRSGVTWSTDAGYRETEEEVRDYQSEGVLTVEMETAALFAAGQVHGIQTAAAYVVGDSLADLRWQPPTDYQTIDQAFLRLYDAVITALEGR